MPDPASLEKQDIRVPMPRFLGENYRANLVLRERFNDRLKEALKAKDQRALATVRLILAALKDRDIAARSKGNKDGIPDDEILQMLQAMVKQRRESVELYRQGNRQELAAQEEALAAPEVMVQWVVTQQVVVAEVAQVVFAVEA